MLIIRTKNAGTTRDEQNVYPRSPWENILGAWGRNDKQTVPNSELDSYTKFYDSYQKIGDALTDAMQECTNAAGDGRWRMRGET